MADLAEKGYTVYQRQFDAAKLKNYGGLRVPGHKQLEELDEGNQLKIHC
jgi:hypothetical protein